MSLTRTTAIPIDVVAYRHNNCRYIIMKGHNKHDDTLRCQCARERAIKVALAAVRDRQGIHKAIHLPDDMVIVNATKILCKGLPPMFGGLVGSTVDILAD